MDDVVRQIVFAAGDEDLSAGDGVAGAVDGFGAGADHAEIGAGVGFGERHRTSCLAAVELRQIGALERFVRVRGDADARAHGERAVEVEVRVGAPEHLLEQRGEHLRQTLPAMGRCPGNAEPAASGQGREGVLEAGRRIHDASIPVRTRGIAALVERQHHVARQLAGFRQHRLREVGVDVHVVHAGPLRVRMEHIEQHEGHVVRGRPVDQHGIRCSNEFACKMSRSFARSARRRRPRRWCRRCGSCFRRLRSTRRWP